MKILIAEDDTTSRLVLSATLNKMGHEVTATDSGRGAWEAMQHEYFPLLISDWMMPDMDGLELCRRIRARISTEYNYAILLTARTGKDNFLDGMDAGADDFITKPFDEDQLAARLRVAQRILDLHETLRTQAMYDALTGLLNRRAITSVLSAELERSAREHTPLAIVLLDLDFFKKVNDTYGHAAGDAVLCEAASRIEKSIRLYDSVGRYGGEEFLIVAPRCSGPDGFSLAERVRDCIAHEPTGGIETEFPITCSLGVAVTGATREDAEAFIQRADEALYRAKANGRNCSELSPTFDQAHSPGF